MFGTLPVLAGSLLISSALPAQDMGPGGRNRVGISYRPAYNISASFTGIGAFAPASNPGPLAGGVDHEYDDGYVRVDSTGNGLGYTWNWGYYDSASQVIGDNLLLSSTSGIGDGRSETSGDFSHGVELTFARELGALGHARWGVEVAGNFLRVNLRDRSTVSSSLIQTTDTYALDGLNPFSPTTSQNPYRGTSLGPGPLIDDAPIARNQQVIAGGNATAGERELEANLWGLRLGPYVEWPLSSRWSVGLNGGLALVVADASFSFREPTLGGRTSKTEFLPGGYAGATVSVALNRSTSVSAGVQYQYVGDMTQSVGGRGAKLELGKSVAFSFGLNFSF